MATEIGRAESIARDMTVEERDEANRMGGPLPCFVTHPDAGGDCCLEGEMLVYGLNFCRLHGEEAKAGAIRELYADAEEYLERLDNPQAPIPNAEAAHALDEARANLGAGRWTNSSEEDRLIRAAYPLLPERVDVETIGFDYGRYDMEMPSDAYHDLRRILHRHMRLAYEEGVVWLVEMLEYEREHVSAQASFAMEDYQRQVGLPES